ncbi:MAG: hypothetical protein J2P20_03960 [Pseudonocardia sp.]|nr:hypothetical protein [Pseudonocardia sp.]
MPHNPAVAGLTRIPLVSVPVGVQMRTDHSLAGRDHLYWHDLETWPIVTMRAGTVMWEMLHRHVTAPDIAVQAMSARGAMVVVGRGAGLGVLARFETSADIPDLIWLPLHDARPVHLCLTQRRDGQPSRSALVVRQLVRAKADELAAPRNP